MADLQIAAVAAAGNAAHLSGKKIFASSSSSASSLCGRSQLTSRGSKLVAARRAVVEEESSLSQNGVAVLPVEENKEGILYSEKFTIRCYEVGTNRRASIQTIANLLQEVACNQVRTLGFSTDGFATTLSMRKHQLIWVTVRMHIEMDEYPLWGDAVEVQTWFQENRHGTRRDWVIKNPKSGRPIGRATSTWVMMNQATRRFARVSDDIKREFRQYALQPPRFAFPMDHKTYQKQHLSRLEDPQYHVAGLKPRSADLDMNHHVNNVAYIGWMMESIPAIVEASHELRSIILEFKHECNHDDSVESMALRIEEEEEEEDEEQQQYLHLLTFEGSSKEINRGWTQWVRVKHE